MKIRLLIFTFLCSVLSWGQVTIASDGLNNATTLFSLTSGAYYSGNSAASGDLPASSPFAIEGTHSFGISSSSSTTATAILTSNANISTCGYSSVTMSLRLASFSVTSTSNGADAGDIVTVEVSPDGGSTWFSTVRVLGNSNATWAYSSTGIASATYDGNVTPTDFQPAGGGNRTTDGYSTIQVTGLPSVNTLKFRITLLNNDIKERWLVDDFKVEGVVTPVLSAPVISSSTATATSTYGAAIANYQIIANNCPTSYAAAGLPAGVTINTTTGLISGTPTVVGTFTVSMTATNVFGDSAIVTKDFVINPKPLSVTGLTSANKVYDGTTTATLGGTATLSGGIVAPDVVTLSGSSVANFASANVGTNYVITVSGYSLTGANAGKYTLSQPIVSNRNITVKSLTISGLTANNKPYDTTTAATLSGTATLVGVVSPDVVIVSCSPIANFNTATVGIGKSVTVSGYTLSGANTSNYSLTQPAGLTANITQATQTHLHLMYKVLEIVQQLQLQ